MKFQQLGALYIVDQFQVDQKYNKGTEQVINPPPIPNKPATNPTGTAVNAINKIK
jgi:hypothetical protein